ncbi:MAG: hypothetical protein PUB39_03610 [Eubacteriales bacterium]|nr:hypothetical protein [Eubacteriales bacterium]
MEVYTLTGPSGTGKSYKAMDICSQYGIESIIDDGLFICNNKVEAGISAKRQPTRAGAVKTALFWNDDVRDRVVSKIAQLNPDKILLLGTSDRMADRISARLCLPAPVKRIHIEDITTPEERATAQEQRLVEGKHIIPVPTLQLKRDFAGYFMNPAQMFRTGGIFGGDDEASDKTVVRPTFSYMGQFFISDKVLDNIAECVAEENPSVDRVLKVYKNTSPDSLKMDVSIAVKADSDIWDTGGKYQTMLTDKIGVMTAFNVEKIDVTVAYMV